MEVEKLRKEAEDCRREAERSSDPADKEFWSRIADGWIELLEKRGDDPAVAGLLWLVRRVGPVFRIGHNPAGSLFLCRKVPDM
jgi:hypothetical protein